MKVLFVDMGDSCTTADVVSFVKNKITVEGLAFDPRLGGRNFDEAIADFVVKDAKVKNPTVEFSPSENSRLWARIIDACDKQVKRILSTSCPSANLSIVDDICDIDYSIEINRDKFLELIKPLLENLMNTVKKALVMARVKPKDLFSVEIVGGGMLLPACQEHLSKSLHVMLSNTMNNEEGVAKGCAYMCAKLSENIRVESDFVIEDIFPYEIDFLVEETKIPGVKLHSVFPKGFYHHLPYMESCRIEVYYNKKEKPVCCSAGQEWIGSYSIPKVPSLTRSTNWIDCVQDQWIDCAYLVDGNGLFSIYQAFVRGTIEKSYSRSFISSCQTMNVQKELSIVCDTLGLPEREINGYAGIELDMAAKDLLAERTMEARNNLESYLYDVRDKLKASADDEMPLASFAREGEISNFLSKIDTLTDWLNEDGRNQPINVYMEKLEEAKTLEDCLLQRKIVASFEDAFFQQKTRIENILVEINRLKSCLDFWNNVASPYNTVTRCSPSDRRKIRACCSGVTEWIQEQKKKLDNSHNAEPAVTDTDVSDLCYRLNTNAGGAIQCLKPEMGETLIVLSVRSCFPNNSDMFDNKELFPDAVFIIDGLEPLSVHLGLLSRASGLVEMAINGGSTSFCSFDKKTKELKWNVKTAESDPTYCRVLVKWLRFCYGADLQIAINECKVCE